MKTEDLDLAQKIIRELLNDPRVNRHLLNWYQNAISDSMLTTDQFETLKRMAAYKAPPQKSQAMRRAQRTSKRPITMPNINMPTMKEAE